MDKQSKSPAMPIYEPAQQQPIDAGRDGNLSLLPRHTPPTDLADASTEVKIAVAEAVTNTVILEAILSILIVACILTLLELSSIIYVVFPSIKMQIKEILQSQSQSSESMKPLKPLIKTLATREIGFTERANTYIQIVAWGFAFLLLMLSLLLVKWINNEYRLQGQRGAPEGTLIKIVFWSFVTIVGIAVFQGFGCIAIGLDSSLCSQDSFAVVSTDWKQNDNFSHIALSTGICDDVADTGSFTDQDFDRVLSLYIAQQFVTPKTSKNIDSDAVKTIFEELSSDEAQDMLNEKFNGLKKMTGVQERT